jgi:hypothetical protein
LKCTFTTFFDRNPEYWGGGGIGPKLKGTIYNPSFSTGMIEMNDKVMGSLSANVYNLTPLYFVNYNSHNNKQKKNVIVI